MSVGALNHVCYMKDHNPVKYKKVIMQIMHEYYDKHYTNQESISDKVKTLAYTDIVQDVEQSEIAVKDLEHFISECNWGYGPMAGFAAISFGLADLLLLCLRLTCA